MAAAANEFIPGDLVIDAKNWPKIMESLEEYLRGHIGVKGVPLYYVVIPKEVVASILDEPATRLS